MRRITGFVGSREGLIHISKIVSTAKKINSKNGSRARVFHLERDISKKGFLVSTNIFFLSLHVGDPTCYTHSLASDYHPTLPFPSGKVFWTKLKTRGFFFGCLFFLSPSSDFNYYVRFALLQPAVLSSQRTRREPNSKVRDKSETKKKGKKRRRVITSIQYRVYNIFFLKERINYYELLLFIVFNAFRINSLYTCSIKCNMYVSRCKRDIYRVERLACFDKFVLVLSYVVAR